MLYQRLKKELADKELFQKASEYAQSYLMQAFDREVYPTEDSLALLSRFDEEVPQHPVSAHEILDQLHQYGSPNTVTLNGGRYFGFVNGGLTPASIAAKWLTDAWDQNTAMNVLSPICGKLEAIVEKWLQTLFGLSPNTVSGFVTGTSMASFCGLIAARHHLYIKQGYEINRQGMVNAPRLRVITSVQTHSTIKKALSMLGFGLDNIEYVEVDDQGRLNTEFLPTLDDTCIVILQAGNVNSGSFDPIEEVCTLANRAGAWVHIDGAFGLWAAVVDQLSYLTMGLEKADSWSVDGHKTLNTPYDCGIIMCKHPESLRSALHMSGSYLIVDDKRDGMFFTPDMSRRARVVDLWSTIKCLGKSGIQEMIQTMHLRATSLARQLTDHGFTIPNEVVFNQVLVHCKDDKTTQRVLQQLQEDRTIWCGGARWFGKAVIRVSICSWTTTEEDIRRTVESFVRLKPS